MNVGLGQPGRSALADPQADPVGPADPAGPVPGPAPVRAGWRRAGPVALVLLLAGALAAGLVVVYRQAGGRPVPVAGRPVGGPSPVEPAVGPAGPVLAALRPAGPVPPPAAIAARLSRPLRDRRLGPRVSAAVIDLATGGTLYDANGGRPAAPASTTKLTTAAAVLASYPADHRFQTRVVAGARPGQVVLVGGGDPTLSRAPAGAPTVYPGAARLVDLAAAVRRSGVRPTSVVVDGSLFTGPAFGPRWDPRDVAGGYVAPITAVMLDGGRLPGADPRSEHPARSAHPDLDAGQALGALLGVPARAVGLGRAVPGARLLGQVSSPPLGRILERTLLASDNVLAEVLARQVALAGHRPASFAGAAAAVRAVLARLGVDVTGDGLLDGSGLSPNDRLSPALLAALLRVASSRQHPELHPLFAGLPVGGYDGTLDDRYRAGPPAAAAGSVRAKTGTLTGVSCLAGVVQTAGARLLAFAFLADRAPSVLEAEAALDAATAALARVG
jgi:D-alanyl-D-alanine carboxypeptidase/D-alanyl-D-alanine-endopeptidase (penicillin-binding protein 4)